jgi:hypothetical protein
VTVYFATRRHRGNPWCIHCHRFKADSVLDWFRSLWNFKPAKPTPTRQEQEAAWELFEQTYPGMADMVNFICDKGWEPPETMRELFTFLEHALWQGGETLFGPHHVQFPGNPDDWEEAIYVFDDQYVAEHPERCAILMRNEPWLPDGAARGAFRPAVRVPVSRLGKGKESVYLCFLTGYDSSCSPEWYGSLQQDGAWKMAGVGLDNLAPRLFAFAQTVATWPGTFNALYQGLQQAVRQVGRGDQADFRDDGTLLELGLKLMPVGQDPPPEEPDEPPDPRNPRKDKRRVQEHVAQASVHMDRAVEPGELFHQWILFDHQWAAAHPDLANSLLRLALRWDVL